jgi:hypothetical protein
MSVRSPFVSCIDLRFYAPCGGGWSAPPLGDSFFTTRVGFGYMYTSRMSQIAVRVTQGKAMA